MIWIPAGAFTMGRKNGDRDARPPHAVSLGGYWIYRAPVTVAQYRSFCEASKGTDWEHQMPAAPKWGWKDDHPMVRVSWQDAVDYGRWAFGDDQRLYLPTEAQYERAMQGPEGYIYPWGDTWSTEGSVSSVGPGRANGTQPVGHRAPNGYGLYDIAGNAWEWCADWYGSDYYRKALPGDPTGPQNGAQRAMRGGGWDATNAKLLRSDSRGKSAPEARTPNIGFRCAAAGSPSGGPQ